MNISKCNLNKEIYELWSKASGDNTPNPMYFPAINEKIPEDGIVFVGINPSLPKEQANVWKYTNLNQTWKKLRKESRRTHKKSKAEQQFFEPHRMLCEKINKKWAHIDIFLHRCTNQAELKKLAIKNDELTNDFWSNQLDFFWKHLDNSRPCVVVVTNALAANIILKSNLGKEKISSYYGGKANIKLNKLEHTIPIFFSGMLTGQRALDVFSRDRLFCQIKEFFSADMSPI